jgi:DNA-binding transcriptional MerR regulator
MSTTPTSVPTPPGGASRLTISELARLTRTTRDTLLFYDKIGLLAPESRGANHYRYYSEKELLKVNFIRTFRSLGVSLKEIKRLLENRTPESVLASLLEQMAVIKRRQARLKQTYLLLETYHDIIEYTLDLDEDAIVLRWCEEEAILVAPRNDYTHGRLLWDNILDSYRFFQGIVSSLEMNYPVWSIYEKESVEDECWRFPDHFYMSDPHGGVGRKVSRLRAPSAGHTSDKIFARREAGWYAIGYARGKYGGSPGLFKRLLAFIEEKGLSVAGRSYVDYLLNEISVKNPDEYLIKIAIEVTAPRS